MKNDWGDIFMGLAFPLAILIIAAFVLYSLLYQSPLAVQP